MKAIFYAFVYTLVCLTMGNAYGQTYNSFTGPASVCPGQEVTYTHSSGSVACAATFSVSSNGTILQYSTSSGTQFVRVRFNTSGTGWVSATVGGGSQYCYSQSRSVQIGMQSVGNISGPTYVACNNPSATYSIPPVAGAGSYTWTVTGSLGFITSSATYSNGGATVTFPASAWSSGSGTVSVTANPSCGGAGVTKSKTVYRSDSDDYITGPQNVCTYGDYTYTSPSGSSNNVWEAVASTQTEQPVITYTTFSSAYIRFPGSPGGGYIRLTYTSACGVPNRVLIYGWNATNCGFGIAPAEQEANATMSLYPNPGYNLVKVTAKEKAPFTAKLYSPLNELVAQAQGKGGEASLRVAGLPEGIYYVHVVSDEGIVSRKRLIIRKQ